MSLIQDLLGELRQEAEVTRRYLASVSFEHKDFQPHEKSEKFGRLAIHVAEILSWWKSCLAHDELDFMGFEPKAISSTEDLLAYFDELLKEAIEALEQATEEDLAKDWSMKYGDDILFTLNKKEVLRKFCYNHLVHHRAQLGVYLRLLNIAVPAVYGPSADDDDITLIYTYD